MDDVVKKIMALGIPGLILLIAISTSGFAGAAAITAGLAALGPFGILGGIATLGLTGILTHAVAEYGIENIIKASIREHLQSKTREQLIVEVNKYPVTKGLKLKLIDYINNCEASQINIHDNKNHQTGLLRPGVDNTVEAAIVLAKCSKHDKTFGIRVEKQNNDWVMTWAFKIDDGRAKREGFDKTVIIGSFGPVAGYPGCPYCKDDSVFLCSCKRLSCWTPKMKSIQCYWCNKKVNHILNVNSISAKSGGY